jgi:predicted DNA-binding antitoxin AbrB/MazE fold protein
MDPEKNSLEDQAPTAQPASSDDGEKPSVTLPGTVEKILKPVDPSEPEKAQIAVDGADDLYKEVRIDNRLQNGNGNEVRLKKGAEVEVTIQAEPEDTIPKEN